MREDGLLDVDSLFLLCVLGRSFFVGVSAIEVGD